MKINKKVLIPVFATAMGLSVIGGVGGAVAWYQYNSKVTTSYIGTSVADTGVLQIGHKVGNNIEWGRDFSLMDDDAELRPVTFGELKTVNMESGVLNDKAYAYPHAGAGEGYLGHSNANAEVEGWTEVSSNPAGYYAQFEVYFKAQQADATDGYKQVKRDVYLSKVILNTLENDKVTENALRVHFDIENSAQESGSKNRLFAKNEHKANNNEPSQGTELKLYGPLNLENPDDPTHTDKYNSTLLNDKLAVYGNHPVGREDDNGQDIGNTPYQDGETMIYGNYGEIQQTEALDSVVAARGQDGKIATDADKLLFTTPETGYVTVTVTVWLEGWEVLETGVNNASSNIWNPTNTADAHIQLGMQFDSGIFRGADLTPNA